MKTSGSHSSTVGAAVYCVVSLILSTAVTDASLQVSAPKTFVNSENRFNRREKFTGHLQKLGSIDFLLLSRKIMMCSVFTITDICSFYIFNALLQEIRQSFEEKTVLLITFLLKRRVLHFLSLEIQDTDHFLLFALFKENYIEGYYCKRRCK